MSAEIEPIRYEAWQPKAVETTATELIQVGNVDTGPTAPWRAAAISAQDASQAVQENRLQSTTPSVGQQIHDACHTAADKAGNAADKIAEALENAKDNVAEAADEVKDFFVGGSGTQLTQQVQIEQIHDANIRSIHGPEIVMVQQADDMQRLNESEKSTMEQVST